MDGFLEVCKSTIKCNHKYYSCKECGAIFCSGKCGRWQESSFGEVNYPEGICEFCINRLKEKKCT